MLQAQSLSDVHLLLAFFSVTAAGVDIVMSSCVMLLKLLDARESLAAVRADVVFHLVVNYFDVRFQIAFSCEDFVADETGDCALPLVHILDVSHQVVPGSRRERAMSAILVLDILVNSLHVLLKNTFENERL